MVNIQEVEILSEMCPCDISNSKGTPCFCYMCEGPIGIERAMKILGYEEEISNEEAYREGFLDGFSLRRGPGSFSEKEISESWKSSETFKYEK